ncbi:MULTISPECIES: stage III sporulation protein SpoIIIAB [Allobacillus]|uniref:Stage III sporulation protein AB n=1 Tax=Allobacillus salarius TaxID=1955272 RepID=A0A556PTG0_9BACI|nr:stage III sporulation protein SpoIIIAB [Allobacillus salarius]TSJ67670.1 stage III sporulation protein AB [Allobacillus salarius]
MKWIGMLLILFTCTWVGLDKSNRYKGRTNQLREFIQALQLMEAEMTFGKLPIQSLFQLLSEQLSQPVSNFFDDINKRLLNVDGSLQDVWQETIHIHSHRLALTKKDLHVLKQFGNTLGLHDLVQQKKQIELASIHLHKQLNESVEEEKRFANMSRTLGLLTGVLIVLVLI